MAMNYVSPETLAMFTLNLLSSCKTGPETFVYPSVTLANTVSLCHRNPFACFKFYGLLLPGTEAGVAFFCGMPICRVRPGVKQP